MALYVDYDKKIGEVTLDTYAWIKDNETGEEHGEMREVTLGIYECNAFFAIIDDRKDDKGEWNLYMFFADKDHLNNCLGLSNKADYKGDNIMNKPDKCVFKKLRLKKSFKCRYKGYGDTNYIISRFIKAFDNITIEIYTD